MNHQKNNRLGKNHRACEHCAVQQLSNHIGLRYITELGTTKKLGQIGYLARFVPKLTQM